VDYIAATLDVSITVDHMTFIPMSERSENRIPHAVPLTIAIDMHRPTAPMAVGETHNSVISL